MLQCTALAVLLAICPVAPVQQKEPPKAPATEDRVRLLEEQVRTLEERVRALEERRAAAPAGDTIRFGDVVVNLKDERPRYYLRLDIFLRVDEAAQRELAPLVERRRAELKTWLITYLAEQSARDVSGAANIDRIRDDMRREFGRILQPKGKVNPIKEVLFEQFILQ